MRIRKEAIDIGIAMIAIANVMRKKERYDDEGIVLLGS